MSIGAVPAFLPFTVDSWGGKRSEHHFLSHAHKDHTVGIEQFAGAIVCTKETEELVKLRHSVLAGPRVTFETIKVGEERSFRMMDGDTFTVRAIDANHCAGAVMLLFRGSFGTVLHTGDCRYDERMGRRLGEQVTSLDAVFLDCTYGTCGVEFPPQAEAVKQALGVVAKSAPSARVYLACDGLGSELILRAVHKRFGCAAIYCSRADKARRDELWHLLGPKTCDRCKKHLMTNDPEATRFHVMCGQQIAEKAVAMVAAAKKRGATPPVVIRPSSQWFRLRDLERLGQPDDPTCGPAPPRDRASPASSPASPHVEAHVHHILYAMHSSRSELKRLLESLPPCAAVPTAGRWDPEVGGCISDPQSPYPTGVWEAMQQRMARAREGRAWARAPEGAEGAGAGGAGARGSACAEAGMRGGARAVAAVGPPGAGCSSIGGGGGGGGGSMGGAEGAVGPPRVGVKRAAAHSPKRPPADAGSRAGAGAPPGAVPTGDGVGRGVNQPPQSQSQSQCCSESGSSLARGGGAEGGEPLRALDPNQAGPERFMNVLLGGGGGL